ncbi:MAG: LysM peptidoglycan-binding domain-containing protein, partial [Anaerolineales bacterium]
MQKSWFKYIPLLGLFVAGVSLACSLSPRSDSAPTFLAPGGESYPTHTPAAVSSIGGGLASTPEIEFPEPDLPATPEVQDTSEPMQIPTPTQTPTETLVNSTPYVYYTQAGDTLPVVSVRFGVQPEEISSPDEIPEQALFNPGQVLIIPNRLANTTSSQHFMPDSEVVYSPSALDFDVSDFVTQSGG